jgi:hypothetical protein
MINQETTSNRYCKVSTLLQLGKPFLYHLSATLQHLSFPPFTLKLATLTDHPSLTYHHLPCRTS